MAAPVEAITLDNSKGITATILTLGAKVQALIALDRNSKGAAQCGPWRACKIRFRAG